MEPLELDDARSARESGDTEQARSRLRQILRKNPHNTAAWMLFAELAVNDLQRVYCLEQVLILDSQNEPARQQLDELRRKAQDSLFAEQPAAAQDSSLPTAEPDSVPPFEEGGEIFTLPESAPEDLPPAQPESEQADTPPLAAQVEKNCPYIGLAHDRMSLTAFPSQENICYRVTPPKGVSLTYQKSFCLSVEHVNCDLLKMPKKRGSLLSLLISKSEKGS